MSETATAVATTSSNNGWYRFPIRVRAHCNPLSIEGFEYPRNPQLVPWDTMYTNNLGKASFLDVGCAYGGLLCDLGASFPDINFLGAEIRDKVVQFSQDRVKQLREKSNTHQNVWFIRTNAMKYLPNYFSKGQLSVMTFCFPDPHFKRKNYRRRIISPTLVSEYAYFLKKGGYLFTITGFCSQIFFSYLVYNILVIRCGRIRKMDAETFR